MTVELTQFLRCRYDEDVAAIEAPESWTGFPAEPYDGPVGTRRVDVDHSIERVVACTRAWRGVHIARYDPTRILAEVAAKRTLLLLHAPEPGQHPDFCGHDKHELPCPTLRLLALPYVDHPNYREEWQP